jgi:prevent-host-death family protein
MLHQTAVKDVSALSHSLSLPRTGARFAVYTASRTVDAAVFRGMAVQLGDSGPPKILPSVTTNELRDNLSQAINRAAFGREPVLVTRRGRKIAAIISIVDLAFLETMRQRRDEAMKEDLPVDQSRIGASMARRLSQELFWGPF